MKYDLLRPIVLFFLLFICVFGGILIYAASVNLNNYTEILFFYFIGSIFSVLGSIGFYHHLKDGYAYYEYEKIKLDEVEHRYFPNGLLVSYKGLAFFYNLYMASKIQKRNFIYILKYYDRKKEFKRWVFCK
jgi:hypothetical protein